MTLSLLPVSALALSALVIAACSSPSQETALPEATFPHHSINYVEFPLKDAEATKRFYSEAFGWAFQDWGPGYVGFMGATVNGGFNDELEAPSGGGTLVVLYSNDLEASMSAVEAAGGRIVKPIFEFPGGRRFHFIDPNGSEIAIWGE